jgi:hypothetical protein
MARISLTSPDFTIFDVLGTIDDRTSMESKREAWRTHRRSRNERMRIGVDGQLEMEATVVL